MINYFVFFFVLIFIVIYIYSLPRKEQFQCRQIGHHAITENDETDKKPCLDIDINAMSDFETLSYYNNIKSIKESEGCNCLDNNSSKKDYKSINIHVINFDEDNVNNYINEVFVNNVIINSLNDIGQSKYVLKSLVNEDYKHNLRRYYHNYPKDQEKHLNSVNSINISYADIHRRYDKSINDKYSINDFVNNDISILRKMLKDEQTPINIITNLITNIITNNDFNKRNYNVIHIIFVPYVKNNILNLDSKLIIIGMYDIFCGSKCSKQTIPILPNKLRKNWITHYFSIKYNENQTKDNEDQSKDILKKKQNDLYAIKKHISDIESNDIYIKNKEKYDTKMYLLKKLYSKDYMSLPKVRQYNNLSKINNKKKRDIIIKELKSIDKLEIQTLNNEASKIKIKIERYNTKFHTHPNHIYDNKTLLELKKMEKKTYDEFVESYNENNTENKKQCKLDIINEKNKTENYLYISKHINYIKNIAIIFKISSIILNKYVIKDKVILEFGQESFFDNTNIPINSDVDKCEYTDNKLLCNESKKYSYSPPHSVKVKDDTIILNKFVTKPPKIITFRKSDSRSYI